MELMLSASPSDEITLSRYDPVLFPKFRPLFESSNSESRLQHLVCPHEEGSTAVVMENCSNKDITALRYCWVVTGEGEDLAEKRHTVSADSYMVDVYHPVLGRGDRKLISWSTSVDESLLDHVFHGGGFIGGAFYRPHFGIVNLFRFEIDFVLFIDGEITGADRDQYAAELQCRKPAAEFVAKQIRLAESEGRDVTPVLSALAEVPHSRSLRHAQEDPLVHWVQRYARDYLRTTPHTINTVNPPEARLRHLENRPTLPKFYRRHGAA